ncbi:MAG: DUF4340 domain-containing protein [Deltaproteobacteria bacterium]|nr:DUF4340 domain-containing protein [Deltaproteobacteria bacterium]
MNFRSTIIAVVVLAVLAGVYFFYEKPRLAGEKETKEAEDRILDLDWDKLESITIRNEFSTLRLEKSDSGVDAWRVVEPYSDDADKFTVQGVVSAVRSTSPDRVVEEKVENWGNYGLDKPRLEATFTADGASKTLLIGTQHTINNTVFAKRADANTLMILPRSVQDAMSRPAMSYRDRRIVPASVDEAVRIEVRRHGKVDFVLTRAEAPAQSGEGDDTDAAPSTPTWKFETPEFRKIDDAKADKLASDFKLLRIGRVLKEVAEEGAGSPFDPPELAVKVTFKTGETAKGYELLFGPLTGDGHERQAIAPKGYLATVPIADFDKLNVQARDFMSLALTDFNLTDVHEVRLQQGGKSINIRRLSPDSFGDEQGNALDSQKILERLRPLVDLKAERFVAKEELWRVNRVLRRPVLQIRLLAEDGTELENLAFGRLNAVGKTPAMAVAAGTHIDEPMVVDLTTLEGWPSSLEDWRAPEASDEPGDEAQAESDDEPAPTPDE